MTQSQVHILVVDDERNIRNNLAMVLEAEGYKVDKASNGDDALMQVKAGLYDIVFVDIQMPKMDGLELLRYLRGSQTQDAGGHADCLRNCKPGRRCNETRSCRLH